MKKSQIPQYSLIDRQIFLDQLALAGWDIIDWDELLDTGTDVEPEAEAHYSGPVFDLLLEYHAEKNYLVFALAQRDGDLFLHLHLYPKGDLAKVLSTIIIMQDNLNEENFPNTIKLLIPLCDPLLIDTHKGLFKLNKKAATKDHSNCISNLLYYWT